MYRIATLIVSLLLCQLTGFSQSFDYGNNWYKANPDQTYIKLVVSEDGIYRADFADFTQAGFDLTGVDAQKMKLLYRGKEVPMYVAQDASHKLIYLEFYGRSNDGKVDSIMYRDPISGLHTPNLQPNKFKSLFTDESAYFLTWGDSDGKRYLNFMDTTYVEYSPEPHFPYVSNSFWTAGQSGGVYSNGGANAYDPNFTLNSDYITGEGYVGPGYNANAPRIWAFTTEKHAPNSENPITVRASVFFRSSGPHSLQIKLDGENTPFVDTTLERGVAIHTIEGKFQAKLNRGTLLEFSSNTPTSEGPDVQNMSVVQIFYDKLFDLGGEGKTSISGWNRATPAFFQFANVVGSDSVFVYDLKNPIRTIGKVVTVGSKKQANIIIPGSTDARDLFMATDGGIQKPLIQDAKLTKLYNPVQPAEYVIISHPDLRESAEAYANYRDTAQINPLSVKLVMVDEIYDQYGYGSITPWAIKRFCKDALDNWTVKPQYFLLWGKGVYRTREEERTIVPSFGFPATDYEYVSHFDQNSIELNPEAAIGRVNLLSNEEGLAYLEKVDIYEHTSWEPWMKKGVFLGGGATVAEQNLIGSGMNYFIGAFSEEDLGGLVYSFQKTSNSTVIDPAAESYHAEIDGGASLIHFFGHSSVNIQDVSIREPFEYSNFGRATFMIAMGCYGGNFTGEKSFGERWITQKERGAIGYLANSSAGYISHLRDYGKSFYDNYFQNNLGKPVGEIIRESFLSYTAESQSIQIRNHARQMNLQGDPAIILHHPTLPDYEINAAGVSFFPDNFSAQTDSFEIRFAVQNLGRVTEDTVAVTIAQTPPNGRRIEHGSIKIPPVYYTDTFSVTLYNVDGGQIAGQNAFEIFVESENKLEEYSETNNRVSVNRIIPGNFPEILCPINHAVIGDNRVTLMASGIFMTREDDIDYVFEIDTSYQFNSPSLINSGDLRGTATLVTWEVPATLSPNTVYYWRVKLKEVEPELWRRASFTYVPNETGWGQSTAYQYNEGTLENINANLETQVWAFDTAFVEYEFATLRGGNFELIREEDLLAAPNFAQGYSEDAIVYTVVDDISLDVKIEDPTFGVVHVAEIPAGLGKFVADMAAVEPGDYVIVGSHRNPRVQTWGDEVFQALASIGVSDSIRNLQDEDPFVLLGRKGGVVNSAQEVYTPNQIGEYKIRTPLFSFLGEGQIVSTEIGPATAWDNVSWDWDALDNGMDDFVSVTIKGVRRDGSDSLIHVNELPPAPYNLNTLNPERFPFLKLEGLVRDTVTRTAPQLAFWKVTHDPAADLVLDLSTDFEFRSDTLEPGDSIYVRLGVRNITAQNVDSFTVRFSLEGRDNIPTVVGNLRLPPLGANGYTEVEFESSTAAITSEGPARLTIHINPEENPIEKNYFNNLYVHPFFIRADRLNPLLDVTFDGKHIINGDIVSPRPEILVELNDENTSIALDDTTNFDLYLRKGLSPADPFERIFINDGLGRVEWTPGELPANKAQIRFYPARNPIYTESGMEAGMYTLRVQGRDGSGNSAGRNGSFYEINFEVVQERTLTQVINYPNPFSTSTRFVYTLTGAELPEVFQIQIYTVSGKMVKVIDLMEMGDISVGRNITDYAWDGTDEYGDPVGNGVYLYRTVVKFSNGFTLRNEETQQYFNNGWGKMYLMR